MILEIHLSPTNSKFGLSHPHLGLFDLRIQETLGFFLPGVYSKVEEEERGEGTVSVSSHRCHHCPVVGAVAGEGSLLVGCLSNVQEDAALLTLFHSQMNTGKTGHPSAPRRMSVILQALPTACSARSDFVLMYFLPWAVVVPLPSVHWRKKGHVMLCLPGVGEQEEGGRRAREIFTIFYIEWCVLDVRMKKNGSAHQ